MNHKKLNFQQSLPIGKKKEENLKQLLLHHPNVITITDNHDFRYDLDLELQNKNITIEVKFDDMCLKTGNFAVEFESRNKPSGISKTQCDFWCFIDSNDKSYFIELSKLKSLCKGKKKIQTKCEDSWNRIYLIRMSTFISHSISINEILM